MATLSQQSIEHIWHPFTQMHTAAPPIGMVRGKGTLLWDEQGNSYLDAISSWWVTIHGHAHPYIAERITEQLHTLEHCLLAGCTHPPAVALAQRILAHLPTGIEKVFFSDNGSTAVEVALKMAIQYWSNRGSARRTILAFEHAYHGDTFGAMSAGARSAFSSHFAPYLFDVQHVPVPVQGNEDNCLRALEEHLRSGDVAAFIYEPLVLGAGGMLMYSPDVLERILALCKRYDVLAIADEVMTGFGRTGAMFASAHCTLAPDIMCLSKGLTGGTLPMALTVCTGELYNAFLSDDAMKTFFHGHSFTGNPIGCAAALASLDLLERDETWHNIRTIEREHTAFAKTLRSYACVQHIRQTGTLLAFDVVLSPEKTGYFNTIRAHLYDFFLANGVLLRPLGNVVYLMPPYCTTVEQLTAIYSVIATALGNLEARE